MRSWGTALELFQLLVCFSFVALSMVCSGEWVFEQNDLSFKLMISLTVLRTCSDAEWDVAAQAQRWQVYQLLVLCHNLKFPTRVQQQYLWTAFQQLPSQTHTAFCLSASVFSPNYSFCTESNLKGSTTQTVIAQDDPILGRGETGCRNASTNWYLHCTVLRLIHGDHCGMEPQLLSIALAGWLTQCLTGLSFSLDLVLPGPAFKPITGLPCFISGSIFREI